MATAQFSTYTPQGLGTVPQATLGNSFLPAFGQGLLQVAKTYQARKSVEQAADEASTLFGDPTYGNIFRQMGLAAVAQGESPTPIINSMLSTAITLKRDQEQMAQRERLAQMQFGQQVSMENLRTANNLREFQTRAAYQESLNTPEAKSDRYFDDLMAKGSAEQAYSETDIGRWAADAQRASEEKKRADALQLEQDKAMQRERGKLEVYRERGLTPSGDRDVSSLIKDAGINMGTKLSDLSYPQLEEQENLILSAGAMGKDVESALNDRLRAVQEQKRIMLDRDKRREQQKLSTPKDQPSTSAQNRYLNL